ncbi:MAG: YcgN family cysteine cluster protein [Desulfuromonadia bacterium]
MTGDRESDLWESICDRCGLCCFEKIEDEKGTIFFTSRACRYLDLQTRQCRIYEKRFLINPECVALTPELVETLHWLHDDCAYRRALEVPRRRPATIQTKEKKKRDG